jgi:hypothetical protein
MKLTDEWNQMTFTSMWHKHCWEDAACRRGMSLEEYIQDQQHLEEQSEVNNEGSK